MIRVCTPDLAEHGHRRHIADLGDLLEDEGGVEDRQPETAVLFRDRHSEDAQLGESAHVLPREGAIHIFERARPELALRQVTDGLHKPALLVG